MVDEQKRRSPRYKVSVPVAFLDSKTGDSSHETVDVSRGGVFIHSELPRAIRQLVRLKIEIPATSQAVEVHGMIVHAISPEDATQKGCSPGMGVEFFGFGGEPRQIWEDFLRGLQSGAHSAGAQSQAPAPAVPQQPAPSAGLPPVGTETFDHTPPPQPGVPMPPQQGAPPMPPAPSGQQYGSPAPQVPFAQPPTPQSSPAPQLPFSSQQSPSAPGCVESGLQQPPDLGGSGAQRPNLVCRVFPVPVQAPNQLYEIYERELVTGSMFLCTQVSVPVGDRVVLRVIHPANRDHFDLHGLVQTVSNDPQYPGVTLALRPSTMRRREKFKAFIEEGLPEEDDLPVDLLDD